MPYCGRYGCGCCTCEKCGQYNGCVCKLKEESMSLIAKWDLDPDSLEQLEERLNYANELKDKLQDWIDKF